MVVPDRFPTIDEPSATPSSVAAFWPLAFARSRLRFGRVSWKAAFWRRAAAGTAISQQRRTKDRSRKFTAARRSRLTEFHGIEFDIDGPTVNTRSLTLPNVACPGHCLRCTNSPSAARRFRFLGGFSIAETAEMLDCPPSTVEADWRFARARLVKWLDEAE